MSQLSKGEDIRHITCEGVTKPLPIFTHATVHKGVAHISCVQGFIPGTFEFPSETPDAQARQVFKNLKTILEQIGSSLSRVVKITIFMTDMHDFPLINQAVNEAFPDAPPARSSIAVHQLPWAAKVVVEAIAAVDGD